MLRPDNSLHRLVRLHPFPTAPSDCSVADAVAQQVFADLTQRLERRQRGPRKGLEDDAGLHVGLEAERSTAVDTARPVEGALASRDRRSISMRCLLTTTATQLG